MTSAMFSFASTLPSTTDSPADPTSYSSSAQPAEAPPAAPAPADGAHYAGGWTSTRPFSALGVELNVGVNGIGVNLATPLAKRFNLRVGGAFFNYSLSTSSDGINYNGTLNMRKASVGVEYYPFHGTFRITPGLTVYNGNHVSAAANIPGGSTFTLDDTDYISGILGVDPVHGSADINFGNRAAPSLTIGWGNMIPRHGGHWSVPFEIGAEFTNPPTLTLNLAGTACQKEPGSQTLDCGSVTDQSSDIYQNVIEEQKELNDDLHPLRFYPILSIGVSYKFGKS
jgi:hypothetical protein